MDAMEYTVRIYWYDSVEAQADLGLPCPGMPRRHIYVFPRCILIFEDMRYEAQKQFFCRFILFIYYFFTFL